MKFFVHFFEVAVGDVGVNLGGGDGAVAEHLLDGADVGAGAEKFGGERMAQFVRGYRFDDTRKSAVTAHDFLHAYGGQSFTFAFRNV